MYARRVALFALRDAQGKVLLQHRTKDAPTKPGVWAFFGGGINDGETEMEAVKREAWEELQIDVKNLCVFKRYKFSKPQGVYEKIVFSAPLLHSLDVLRSQQREGDDLGLFSFEEISSLKISDSDRDILKELFGKSQMEVEHQ